MEKYIKRIESEIDKSLQREIDRYRQSNVSSAKEEYGIRTGLMLALDILLNKKKKTNDKEKR